MPHKICENTLEVYCDGSAIDDVMAYCFAVIKNGKLVYTENDIVPNQNLRTNHHALVSEIYAAYKALKFVKEETDFTKMVLVYDCKTVERIAFGLETPRVSIEYDFKEFVDTCNLQIKWKKVKGHSGNKWNDFVHKDAKLMSTMTYRQRETEKTIYKNKKHERFERKNRK